MFKMTNWIIKSAFVVAIVFAQGALAEPSAENGTRTAEVKSEKIPKVRDIIKIDGAPVAVIKAGWRERGSLWGFAKFLGIMGWTQWYRGISGDFNHDGYAPQGPTALFVYVATKKPFLWEFMDAIREAHAKSQYIDYKELDSYKKNAAQNNQPLIARSGKYDFPALKEIKDLLDEAGIEEVVFTQANTPEMIQYYKDYLEQNPNLPLKDRELVEMLIDPAKQTPGWLKIVDRIK
jgi:hypothetical protein